MSSRVPIGVAHTASGTSEPFERHQSGADQPGAAAELCAHDLERLAPRRESLTHDAGRVPPGSERVTQDGEACGGNEVIERSDPEATADDHARRPEDIDER